MSNAATLIATTENKPAKDISDLQHRVLDASRWTKQTGRFGDIVVEPYSATVGAVVKGFRPAIHQAPEVSQFLYAQLLEHGFLSFEPGTVGPENFVDVVRVFGEPSYMGTPHTPKSQVNEAANTIDSRTKKTRSNYIWHIDQAFKENPTRFTALFGEVVPDVGGDTIFANATAAYDLLDPLLANYLETLTAIQSFDAQGFLTYAYSHDPVKLAEQRAVNPPMETPVIKVHPETGKKQIFVNELYTMRIAGLSPVASQSILNLLFDVIKSPEIQTRYRWEAGAALIWDNRTVQHRGVYDFGTARRLLHRAVVA